ncbi:MAG: hypothetical protein ACFE9S_05160 [Candidatus Hermodarchaeota archaeon]
MNFAIPRNNTSEMILYIWKIIDLPFISFNDLLFRISFDLYLDSPEKAKKFIKRCIEDNVLIIDDKQNLKLSKELNKQLIEWQKTRKVMVLKKIKTANKIEHLKDDISKKSTNFSILINAFVDKGTLNRSVSVSDNAFEILKFDRSQGIIESKVKGSKEESYVIEIDTNNKVLRHTCHDFETRRANTKKFCKHITKLFLLLKDKNEKLAEFFLNDIAENIDMWDFTT